jgi:hypothetical protein
MSAGSTPPSRRVAKFTERLGGNPLGEPSGGRTLTWLVSRVGIVAGLAIVGWFVFWGLAWTCACTPRPSYPASPVEGVVVSVSSPSLGQVRSFDVRLNNGGQLHFLVGTLENATEFSPSHLAEHQVTSAPVRVFFRVGGDGYRLDAYRLEDAAVAEPS